MVNKWRDVRNNKNMKRVHNIALCSMMWIFTQSSAQGSTLSALVVCLIYVQPLWLYTGICWMYTCTNNPLDQFITAQEVDFLIISSLFSVLYFPSSVIGEVGTKNSEKITDYCYIQPLCHIKILAQSVHYSSRNRFPDYWLIVLISISFQFYYWRSSKWKILEKSRSTATYPHHYIIYKLKLNPFTITEVINFLQNF